MQFATLARPFVPVLLAALWLAPSAAIGEPRVKITPAEIDLGVIQEGNLFERFVEIENVGDGVLVLEDVKTSCGCTAAAVEGVVELTNGQSQRVRVTFNSNNMDGDIKKKVTITTNDMEQKNSIVLIKATVHKPIRWQPKYLNLNQVGVNDDWSQLVRLESDAALDLEVQEAFIVGGPQRNRMSNLFEIAQAGPVTEGDREVHEFTLRLTEGVRPQKVSETLIVVTNQPADKDSLRFPIRGQILGRIRNHPTLAVLKMVEPGEVATRDINFSCSEGQFEIKSAEVPDSPVQVEVFPQPNGQQSVVRLTYTGEEPGTNGMRTLRVETDDPDQPVIEISVRYQTRTKAKQPSTEVSTEVGAAGPQ